jgi:hypothetical protein
VITWGYLQRISWRGFFAYCDEAYAPLAVGDWLSGKATAPNGLDVAALVADLRLL